MSLASEKMDPLNSFLGKILMEEISPVVMVLATHLAEDACQRNGLSFTETLLPFSLFNKIDVPVRTASDQPYRLQMFKLRLVYASDIHLQDYEAAAEQLKKVVTDASDKSISDLRSDPPQLETVLNKFEPGAWPSWIQMFNKELIRTLSFSEHEAFDHPVACLLVVSSKDEQPINKFVDLFNTNKLPSLLNEGAMDPKILKNYVLLHDNHDGTPEKAASILAEMRNTFGSNDCKLLCINSAQGTDDGLKENPWAPFKTHASLNQDSTCFLNVDDLNGIREFMQDFSSKNVIPHMEQKIRILNQQVSATRKGFRNQIKNLWWRKGKDDAPENLNGPTYTFSSIESQIRVLADYAFMLRDYELALSNYRLLSTDYKLDKSWKRYAGVQEMMGLSYFMLDQSRKESEYCMENAFNTYLKIGSSGQRNGTRCGLWWAEMLKAREQYKDAATIYFRISREEPYLHAAVMLEQASYCYLFSFPRMLRKYGLHLILAGNRYYIANQRYHAIRTYRSVLFVYEGNAWSYISNHVHFNIGRWYAFLGISDVATKYMLEVLPCSHLSVSTQELFLTEFCKTVQNMGKLFEVCKLKLPVINMSSLKVIYEDHRTYASSADVNVGESIWYSLEEEMVPTASAVRSNWLETEPKFNPLKKHNDSKVSVAGEAIKLELECKNPLQISISLSGVSLICEFSANSEATKLDECVSDAGVHRDAELKESPSCSNSDNDVSLVTLSELNVILEGRETKKVQLDVTPKVEGFLKIIGVRWTLSGSVVGYHYFDFDTKKKQRKGRSLGHPSSRNLNFIVIKGLPKLEGVIQHLPKKVYTGDLRLLTLELRNHSEYRVKNLKMAISHPRFLIPGDLEDLNLSFPSCLEKQPSSGSKDVIQKILEKSKSLLFTFPNGVSIEGGTTFKWPLWFHTGISGNVSFYISIYYEMECCSSDMTYRTLRMHYDLEVMPSIDVSFLITPCPLKLQEFLVRMDIVNRTLSESFSLHQLSCVGDKWQISLLPGCAALGPMQVVPATQAISCFFKLKNCRNSSSSESKIIVQGNVVQLSKGSEEILIDTAKSPLADFHHHERYHQVKSSEGSSSVDFILISKMLENESYLGTGVSPQLLSNHSCHCSITCKSPVWWLMEGPRTIAHDFSSSLCQPSLRLTIRNCSFTDVFIRVATFDTTGNKGLSRDAVQLADPSGIHGGWHEVSLVNDIKAITDIHGSRSRKPLPQSISPFVWCASSATQLVIGPGSSAEVPVSVCVFSPGTYDLSSYEVHWKLQQSDNDGNKWLSGTNRGHPFSLTVLQSPL